LWEELLSPPTHPKASTCQYTVTPPEEPNTPKSSHYPSLRPPICPSPLKHGEWHIARFQSSYGIYAIAVPSK